MSTEKAISAKTKVYCIECIFCEKDILWNIYNCMFGREIVFEDTPIKKVQKMINHNDCETKNKNNDCADFKKRKWWQA